MENNESSESQPLGSGSLVQNLEAAAPVASTNSSKRPRDDGGETNETQVKDTTPTKRSKIEEAAEAENHAEPTDNGNTSKPSNEEEKEKLKRSLAAALSPVVTRRRAGAKKRAAKVASTPVAAVAAAVCEDAILSTPSSKEEVKQETEPCHPRINGNGDRWIVHQMTEDYVNFVGQMMYPSTELGPYGFNPNKREYPIQGISVLGLLKNPCRRPSVIERWSPYEIAMFEGSLLHYGKEFHLVSREIGTKTTKDVIDFYYTWKKTAHYKKWKEQYVSDLDLLDMEESPPVKKGKTIK